MNGQGTGAETIPFSVAVKAQGNIEDWLCDLLFKMQVPFPVDMLLLQFDHILIEKQCLRQLTLAHLPSLCSPFRDATLVVPH